MIKHLFIMLLLTTLSLSQSNKEPVLSGSAALKSCSFDYFKNYLIPGYPAESHQIITEDGYKLTLFRIQKKGTSITKGLPPVLLQHGINGSGVDWIFNGEDASLTYMLANAGFDVYLGNSRGNRYSREHVSLDPKSKEFWGFSFQEMGEKDVPANFKAIRELSGVNKITYIGHSQGTSQMFAALSDPAIRPKVAPYLESFNALAPVVFLTNTEILGMKLAKILEWAMNPILNTFNINHLELGKCEFNPSLIPKYQAECSKKQCSFSKNTDPYQDTLNYQYYGIFENGSPAGYSMRCAVHYAQLIKENRNRPVFKKYNYGSRAENRKHYGQDEPPVYNLGIIQEKVRLFLGESDRLADIKDTRRISGFLTNAKLQVVSQPRWGHMAFLQAKDGKNFYNSIISQIISDINQ